MKQPKLPADPGALIGFFEEGLDRLGAICDRTWHDKMDVLAEGTPARLWRDADTLHSVTLDFPEPGATGQRDAATQVFPGCPLTFRLVETLWQTGLPQMRAALAATPDAGSPPVPAVAAKTWQNQFGQPAQLDETAWMPAWHFSLVATVRCEIQAIDQHWSSHRLAIALATGERDDRLAAELDFLGIHHPAPDTVSWPSINPAKWESALHNALLSDLGDDLNKIKQRQQRYLARELERLDEYFTQYESELAGRLARQQKAESKTRYEDRLKAAKAEHARRREDQVHRHEIRVIPHLDTLLLTAEAAWQTRGHWRRGETIPQALYIPRTRHWLQSGD